MVILALETATRGGSLAMIAGEWRAARIGGTGRTHSERLPRELFDFVTASGRELQDVDALCVVTGPGSFTGLRIGLAAVQGLAMTAGKKVMPVPTMEAMAAAWKDRTPGASTRLITCLDGARGDVFIAGFEMQPGTATTFTGITQPEVLTPADVAARVATIAAGRPFVVAGDVGARYRDAFSRPGSGVTFDDRPLNLALGAALLAREGRVDAVAPHALRPLYVRRPDAELARERARQRDELTFAPAVTPEDLTAIAELQRGSFANAWGAEAIQWELDNSNVARLYAARATHGAIVAYCACWVVFDELHINSIAVDRASRRHGIAKRLLEYVLAEAVAAGVRGATLEVRQSNEPARKLYEGLGFRVEGVRRDYYQDPREDALILWHRDLPGRFARR